MMPEKFVEGNSNEIVWKDIELDIWYIQIIASLVWQIYLPKFLKLTDYYNYNFEFNVSVAKFRCADAKKGIHFR